MDAEPERPSQPDPSPPPPAGRRRRAGKITAITVAAAVVVAGGYFTADAFDIVPGPLTTKPAEYVDPLPKPEAHVAATSAAKSLGTDAPVPSDLDKVLAPLVGAKAVKGKIGVEVRDAATNKVLYAHDAKKQKTPASVTKLLTASAALGMIGADTTLKTRAELNKQGDASATISLAGGGDILLGAGASDPTSVVGHAGLGSLANDTAKRLKKDGVTSVTLRSDLSRYSGSTFSKAWSRADIRNGYINPIVPLMVDAGKLGAGEHAPRSTDPAGDALKKFAKSLQDKGIKVNTAKPVAKKPEQHTTLATVESAPLVSQVQYMLLNSDNVGAEVLGVEVARAMDMDASIARAPKGVIAALDKLGLSTGSIHLGDTSGLDYSNRISPHELAAILSKNATATDSLSQVIPNLPVSGLSGTLTDRYRDSGSKRAAGLVSAKTGTLKTVNSLGGVVPTADGRLLVFTIMSDNLAASSADAVRKAYDDAVAGLSDCGCD